ncbi:MAG: hypothetical protein V3S70_07445, partial [Gammaproteobacteria bacterium]
MNTPRIAGWLSPLLACLVLSGCTQEAQQAEATAQEGTTATEEDAPADIEYLFVQTADGVMLENGVLRLMGVSPSTLFFSDRPERVTGHTPTAYFVAHWASGTDGQSFADVPPNAALSILEAGEADEGRVPDIAQRPAPQITGFDSQISYLYGYPGSDNIKYRHAENTSAAEFTEEGRDRPHS